MEAFWWDYVQDIWREAERLLPRLDLLTFSAFTAGCDYRLLAERTADRSVLTPPIEFVEYLRKKKDGEGDIGGATMIALSNSNDEAALREYLSLLEEFIRTSTLAYSFTSNPRKVVVPERVDRYDILERIYGKPVLYLGAKQITALNAFLSGDGYALSRLGFRVIEEPTWESIGAVWRRDNGFGPDVDFRHALLLRSDYDESVAFESCFSTLFRMVERKRQAGSGE